jgi:hypothetical protein
MILRDKVHRLSAVVRFGDDFEIRLLLEQKLDAGSNDRVVIGEEDPDLFQAREPPISDVDRHASGERPLTTVL